MSFTVLYYDVSAVLMIPSWSINVDQTAGTDAGACISVLAQELHDCSKLVAMDFPERAV